MTRREFVEEINCFEELIDICGQYGCEICEDVISRDAMHELIAADMYEYAYEYDWRDIRRWLNEIPTDAAYYLKEACFEYLPIDREFDDYKQGVLEWMDDQENWEAEDDDEFEESPDQPVSCDCDDISDEPIYDEDITIVELCSICKSTLQKISKDDSAGDLRICDSVTICAC